MPANTRNLRPDGYRARVVDARVEKMLRAFGGVEITGPKWCGKTWTALAHSRSADTLMDPATLAAARTDPALVLEGAEPHLVDEWQEVPQIWDASRNRIDANANRRGQLILTGSSAPKDTGAIRHSGTGRIARVRMRPMALSESGDSGGGVSFSRLFDGGFEAGARRPTSIADIARWCCRGGWPSLIGLDDEFALETPAEYIRNVNEVNVPRLGKSQATSLALMRALAFNLGQAPTHRTLASDMGEDGDPGPARQTVTSYLEMLEDLYIIEGLPGWSPQPRGKNRIRVKPKRYFVDPSLPAALIGTDPVALLRDTQTLGGLFETLCFRDLSVYLSAMPGAANRIHYYRDEKGLEVDFVVELSDGRWGAFEAKLSDAKADDAAADKLMAFRQKTTRNPLAQMRPPEFLALLVGKGDIAYRRSDGVLVIPVAALEA